MSGRHLTARRVAPAVAALLLGLVAAPSALASTASVSGGTLTVAAAPGEQNVVTVWRTANDGSGRQVIHVHDADGVATPPNLLTPPPAIPLLAGPGCAAAGSHEVACTASSFSKISVALGDGDDYFGTAPGLGLPGAAVQGGAGDDYLDGTPNGDTLDGGDGSDELFGEAGNDTLVPGTGADGTISGGLGTDIVDYSSRSTDQAVSLDGRANDGSAGEGDNVGSDVESVFTGAGDDVVTGTSAANVIRTAGGDDRVTGNGGDDVVDAGAGNNTVTTGAGADSVSAGAGDDTISTGAGDDSVIAGDGANTVTTGDGNDTVTSGNGGGVFDLGAGDDALTAGSGVNRVTAGDGADRVQTGTAADVVDGGAGDDTLLAGPGANTVNAGDGNDTVGTGSGDDTINGGDGADVLDAGSGVNAVNGGAGDDRLTASGGNDRLDGGAGDDQLIANGGDDFLQGGAGADVLDPGAGTDTVSYADKTDGVYVDLRGFGIRSGTGCMPGDADACENDEITSPAENIVGGSGDDLFVAGVEANAFHGGDGFDTVSYADRANALSVTLDGVANDGRSGEGDNVFGDVESVIGGDGNDTLVGSDARNTLRGGRGDDTLDGRGGPDVLDGGDGHDTADYSSRTSGVNVSMDGAANDGASGEGDDVVGVENVTGGTGNDTLTGDAGANRLTGGAGDDTLDGGLGADVLDGGDGTDTAVYDRPAGSAVSVKLDDLANDGAAGEGDNVLPSIENVTGGAENDSFLGSASANVLDGGAGDDSLAGAQGDDVLRGGAGNDALDGGAGDDSLQPGVGADDVVGGAGTDTADYSERTAAVSVTFDDVANDGEAGEGDNVHSDVERSALPGSAGAEAPAGASTAAAAAASSRTAAAATRAPAPRLARPTRSLAVRTGTLRSRGGRVRFTVTGRLAGATSCAGGKVRISVIPRWGTVVRRTVALRRDCSFSAPMTVRAARRSRLVLEVRSPSAPAVVTKRLTVS